MTIAETGWTMVAEGTKWEHAESLVKLLDEPIPMDMLLVEMLANSCGGQYYRVKDGEIYSQELDDKVYSSHPWREDWEEKGWMIASEFSFNLPHNGSKILVSFKWTPEDEEGDREIIGGEIIGYAFNYC